MFRFWKKKDKNARASNGRYQHGNEELIEELTLKSEAAGRADIALAIRRPLGIVTHDLGSGRGKPLEDNLGDG